MSYIQPLKYDAATLAQMRALWEGSELSAAQIGERFGVSKNTIIGQARRQGWTARQSNGPPKPEPRTMADRLEALHGRMDGVLAETRPFVEGRQKMLVGADARRAEA